VRVFLSWSGETSKAVAEALHRWLPNVLQFVDPWMSAISIETGTRWSNGLAEELRGTRFGILCLTPENRDAPWLMFEAGALSKTVRTAFVCPYLIGLEPHDLVGPLAQFQATRANRDGTRSLLRSINQACTGPALSERQLQEAFNNWWPKLQKSLNGLQESPQPNHQALENEKGMIKEILERLKNIAPRPDIDLYLLLTFASNSGTGAYEYRGTRHLFHVDAANISNKPAKGEQIEVGLYFNTLEELLDFCKREHLKERKNGFYSSLFVRRISPGRCIKVLRFLDDARFQRVSVSHALVSALEEVVDVDWIAEIIIHAHNLRLENVTYCLARELSSIVFSVPALDALRRATSKGDLIAASLKAKKASV
jgi:hypothetical protein